MDANILPELVDVPRATPTSITFDDFRRYGLCYVQHAMDDDLLFGFDQGSFDGRGLGARSFSSPGTQNTGAIYRTDKKGKYKDPEKTSLWGKPILDSGMCDLDTSLYMGALHHEMTRYSRTMVRALRGSLYERTFFDGVGQLCALRRFYYTKAESMGWHIDANAFSLLASKGDGSTVIYHNNVRHRLVVPEGYFVAILGHQWRRFGPPPLHGSWVHGKREVIAFFVGWWPILPFSMLGAICRTQKFWRNR